MSVTARRALPQAQRQARAAITGLFQSIADRIGGVLLRASDADGVIPLQRDQAVRDQAREIVEPLFVERVRVRSQRLREERAHLEDLIQRARQDLDNAPAKDRARIRGRLVMLGNRLTRLERDGIALVAISLNPGPRSEYARLLLEALGVAVRGPVEAHAAQMERVLANAPAVATWLRGVRPPYRLTLARFEPTVLWQDTRGYTLSDRIWRVSEATIGRIDAILRDGIAEGRAAVDIARDLERFLQPSRANIRTLRPYGYDGSFDARRLARSEITRAHGMASYVAGVTNPFVTRARYHLSASHREDNCDGTCDAHYAEDQANDGFEPDEVPIPMVDTHPQCLCYITHEVVSQDEATAIIREDLYPPTDRPQQPPVTPILLDVMITPLIGFDYADAGR
jgi:hypothetical protein